MNEALSLLKEKILRIPLLDWTRCCFGSQFCFHFKGTFANLTLIDWSRLVAYIALIAFSQAWRTSLTTKHRGRHNMTVSLTEARELTITPS